jgi:hypothetical protein
MRSRPEAFDCLLYQELYAFLHSAFVVSADQVKRHLLPRYEEIYPSETSRFRLKRLADDVALMEHKTFYAEPCEVLPRILAREKPRDAPFSGLAHTLVIKWHAAAVSVDIGDSPLFRCAATDNVPPVRAFRELVEEHPARNPGWNYDLSKPLVPLFSESLILKLHVDSRSEIAYAKLLKQHISLNELWLRDPRKGEPALYLFAPTPHKASEFYRGRTRLWYLWNDKPEDLLKLCESAHEKGEDFEIW